MSRPSVQKDAPTPKAPQNGGPPEPQLAPPTLEMFATGFGAEVEDDEQLGKVLHMGFLSGGFVAEIKLPVAAIPAMMKAMHAALQEAKHEDSKGIVVANNADLSKLTKGMEPK